MKAQIDEHVVAVADHLRAHFGDAPHLVLNALLPWRVSAEDYLRIHVHVLSPRHGLHKLLVTSGMSSLPLYDEEGKEHFSELMLLVPADTAFGESPAQSPNAWMFDVLIEAALLPHQNETLLRHGESVQHSADFAPYSNDTKFCGALLVSSFSYESDFTEIKTARGKIELLSLIPVYADELKYKLKHGFSDLMDRMVEREMNETLDPKRRSVCGLWR